MVIETYNILVKLLFSNKREQNIEISILKSTLIFDLTIKILYLTYILLIYDKKNSCYL